MTLKTEKDLAFGFGRTSLLHEEGQMPALDAKQGEHEMLVTLLWKIFIFSSVSGTHDLRTS